MTQYLRFLIVKELDFEYISHCQALSTHERKDII